ncbi:MAG: DNA polymerase III subunit gamma/tau [Candidatus Nanopelagicales bacterium]
MSIALYRTYRPAQLSEVIGQDHVVTALTRAIENDRIHHAYLFTGPRGCGKTSTARILARSLNCAQGPTTNPCGVCNSCIALAPNGVGNLDVEELDAASNSSVDDVRALRDTAVFVPAESRFRFMIIDEAHQLSSKAIDAFLKMVEEPPAHLKFIFATTEPDKMPNTLRSRTHQFNFRLVSTKTIASHLAEICKQEKIKYEPAAIMLLAEAAAGSVRDGLSLLGQAIAGAGATGLTADDVGGVLGLTPRHLVNAAVDAVVENSGNALFQVIDQVIDAGYEPRRFASDLLQRVRDLLLVEVASDAAKPLLAVPAEELASMANQAKQIGAARLSRAADLLTSGIAQLRGATAPRLQLELLAARLLLAASSEGIAGLEHRVSLLEKTGGATPAPTNTAPVAETKSAPPPKISTIKSSAKTETKKVTIPVAAKRYESKAKLAPMTDLPVAELAKLRALWPAILENLKLISRVAWTTFHEAEVLSVEDGVIAIAIPDLKVLEFAQGSDHEAKLRRAINEVTDSDGEIALLPASNPSLGRDAKRIDDEARIDDEVIEEVDTMKLLESQLGAKPITDRDV